MPDPEIRPALTPEEWAEMEIESHYGVAKTSLYVDYKGRLFARSEMPGGEEEIVILNEAVDAPVVLAKVAALCLYGQPFGFTAEEANALTDLLNLVDPADIEELVAHSRSALAKIAALLPSPP